jgi:hypothetical protein
MMRESARGNRSACVADLLSLTIHVILCYNVP